MKSKTEPGPVMQVLVSVDLGTVVLQSTNPAEIKQKTMLARRIALIAQKRAGDISALTCPPCRSGRKSRRSRRSFGAPGGSSCSRLSPLPGTCIST